MFYHVWFHHTEKVARSALHDETPFAAASLYLPEFVSVNIVFSFCAWLCALKAVSNAGPQRSATHWCPWKERETLGWFEVDTVWCNFPFESNIEHSDLQPVQTTVVLGLDWWLVFELTTGSFAPENRNVQKERSTYAACHGVEVMTRSSQSNFLFRHIMPSLEFSDLRSVHHGPAFPL